MTYIVFISILHRDCLKDVPVLDEEDLSNNDIQLSHIVLFTAETRGNKRKQDLMVFIY